MTCRGYSLRVAKKRRQKVKRTLVLEGRPGWNHEVVRMGEADMLVAVLVKCPDQCKDAPPCDVFRVTIERLPQDDGKDAR